MMEKEEEIGSS